MNIAGLFLLLAGWLLALAALVLLPTLPGRTGFIAAALGVQILGLVLAIRGHLPRRGDQQT